MVIRKAKRSERDKLMLNCNIKVKTTWDIVNRECGRNKKK
jgi:hypothetical protein